MNYELLLILFLSTLVVFLSIYTWKRKAKVDYLKKQHLQEREKLQNLYHRIRLQNEKLKVKELELENKNQELEHSNLVVVKENEKLQIQKEKILQQQAEIEAQSQEIMHQIEEIAHQNSMLFKQKEEIGKINEGLVWNNQIMEEANGKMREQHRMITDSIRYARNIQEAMLPGRQAISESFAEHFIFFQPRELVSGDFYWHARKNGLSFIAAVDCTGHGVPGAFMSMIGNTFLRKAILEEGIDRPDEILKLMNDLVQVTLQQDSNKNMDGMDIALCVWNEQEKTLWYAGAKNPLWLIENGMVRVVKGSRRPVGGFQFGKEVEYDFHEVSISSPTNCYIFTDGFQDQFGGASGRKYLSQKLKDFILSIQDETMENQRKLLNREIADWMGGEHPQIDDMLVIGFQVG